MLTIEKREKEVIVDDGSKIIVKYMLINGIADENSYWYNDEDDTPSISLSNDDIVNILTGHTFSEVGKLFSKFLYELKVEWWHNSIDLEINCNNSKKFQRPSIAIHLELKKWENWAKPWSMSSVAKEIEKGISELNEAKIKYWQEDTDSIMEGFGIEYFPSSHELTINSEVNYIINILEEVINKTNQNLLTSIDKESVLTYFQFPDEIKTACKQYLIYFTQFIADMGILVDTELKEELNHTLFKIIPKDKDESLKKIREALSIYINAPNDQNFELHISNHRDIAVKQWEANVYHLKSQLSLAASILEAKDSTIEMLQISNYQYKQLLESHSVKKKSDEEEVIKGIFSVKKLEGKGFSIDIAEIFRRLKRTFKK